MTYITQQTASILRAALRKYIHVLLLDDPVIEVLILVETAKFLCFVEDTLELVGLPKASIDNEVENELLIWPSLLKYVKLSNG